MVRNKSVLVCCGTKFHSDYMASQLDKHGLLNKVVTAHPKSRYLNRVSQKKGKIKFLPPQRDEQTGKTSYYPELGFVNIADSGKVNRYLSVPTVRNSFPTNIKFLYGKQDRDKDGKLSPMLRLYAIKTLPGRDKAELEGDAIEDAHQEFDQVTNEVGVAMEMNPGGSKTWAKMTVKAFSLYCSILFYRSDW